MNKSSLSAQEYRQLIGRIAKIIYSKGLKATTMDSVAAALGMSKRTLYEIFESKNKMIIECFDEAGKLFSKRIDAVFDNSSNILEAFIDLFCLHRDMMHNLNHKFFDDLDKFYAEVRNDYDELKKQRQKHVLEMLQAGCEQGYFRTDINYRALEKIRYVQMLSIKRAEEFYGNEISVDELLDCMNVAFLRSIVTPEHLAELDSLLHAKGMINSPYSYMRKGGIPTPSEPDPALSF